MDDFYTHESQGPALSDPISIELYSKEKLNVDIKAKLTSNITSRLPLNQGNTALVIGAKIGATAELLVPYCQKIDLVAESQYIPILQARLKHLKDIHFVFKKEGQLGKKRVLTKPTIKKQLKSNLSCEINVVNVNSFCEGVKGSYDIILLQDVIVHPQINIIKELMKLKHELLMTMIVPGKVAHQQLFELLSVLEVNILNVFYEQISHQSIQYLRYLTGRRKELNIWEVFVWKRKQSEDVNKQMKEIQTILNQQISMNQIMATEQPKGSDIYETNKSIDQYMDFHYGASEPFGVRNFPLVCAEKCKAIADKCNIQGERALDIGCAVGRSTIELSNRFKESIGIDYSHGFIKAANDYLNENFPTLKDKLKFYQGDACNLNKDLGKFDLIFGGNLVDRLPSPEKFLREIKHFMTKKSVLILTSPYTWLQQYTPKQKWVGGYMKDGNEISTYDGIKAILESEGLKEAMAPEDVNFVIKDNNWVYQHTAAQMTYWLQQ